MYELQMSGGSKKHKSWVALLTGLSTQYGFERKFINAAEYGVWNLEDGIYNIKDGSKSEQQFIKIEDNQSTIITKEEALSLVEKGEK